MAYTEAKAVLLLSFFIMCQTVSASGSDYPKKDVTVDNGNEKWGYVTVRPEAHMFWWLYRSTSPKGYTNVPLVLWLQGGPGGSSTGFGNFEEIGPLDVHLKPRNTTWLSRVNLLFIDNPVGTGYSYVDNANAFTTDNRQIATDLLTAFKAFVEENEEFSSVPFYIFSESYGGKMTAQFSQSLYKAIKSGILKCKFEGFAMGDSWISPVDSTFSWGPYLYVNSLIDRTQLRKLNKTAESIAKAADNGQWSEATSLWSQLEDQVESFTDNVNFYNIQKWSTQGQTASLKSRNNLTSLDRAFVRHVKQLQEDPLAALMNGPIRKKLGCIPPNVTWGGQSSEVFAHLEEDFMKPVSDIVNSMILNSSVKVVVYSGQLDLIVDNLGTEAWVYRLKIAEDFSKAPKVPITIDGYPQAFLKKVRNFQYYYMLAVGHMVPQDNGPAALKMLESVIGE